MNKVMLIGNLTRDPEVRYTQSGKAVTRFALAVNRRGRRDEGQQPTADFPTIVAWDKLAEICGNNLTKGRRIYVEGRLRTGSYEAQDGTKRYTTEIVMSDMEFLDSKNSAPRDDGFPQDGDYPFASGSGASAPAAAKNSGTFGGDIADEEIPF